MEVNIFPQPSHGSITPRKKYQNESGCIICVHAAKPGHRSFSFLSILLSRLKFSDVHVRKRKFWNSL